MRLTNADRNALANILRRAEDDWYAYRDSGHGPSDFPTRQEWRDHIRQVESDIRRVRALLQTARASRNGGWR